jgi:hypothetical protein
MTARTDRKNRMTAAAAARTAPEAKPAGQTAIRTKAVRITVDLDPVAYTALNKWIADNAAQVNPDLPRLSQSATVRAMIDAAVKDDTVTLVVLDLLRKDRQQS